MPKPKQELTATATDMLPSEKAPLREWIARIIHDWGVAIISGDQRIASKRRDEFEQGLRRWAEIGEIDVTAAAEELANDFREDVGQFPPWGIPGRFVVSVEGLSADITYGGLFDPKITARAIEWDKPFLTPWGSLELDPKSVAMQGGNPLVWIRLLLTKARQDFGETLCAIDRGEGPGDDPEWQEGGYYDGITEGKYRGWKPGQAEAVEAEAVDAEFVEAPAEAATTEKPNRRPRVKFAPLQGLAPEADTLRGDMRDTLVRVFQAYARDTDGTQFWNTLPQREQENIIRQMDTAVLRAMRDIWNMQAVAAVDRAAIEAHIAKVGWADKQTLEIKLVAKRTDEAVVALNKATGEQVLLTVSPVGSMSGERAPFPTMPDQLDLEDAVRAAQPAEPAEPAQAEAA